MSCSMSDHPSRPFLDRTLREHFSQVVWSEGLLTELKGVRRKLKGLFFFYFQLRTVQVAGKDGTVTEDSVTDISHNKKPGLVRGWIASTKEATCWTS